MKNQNTANKISYKVDSLTVYEVKEEELDILKKGPQNKYPFLLELSIFLFGVFVSCLLAFLGGINFETKYYENIFYILSFVSLIVGSIVFILYFIIKKDSEFQGCVNKIIQRKTID